MADEWEDVDFGATDTSSSVAAPIISDSITDEWEDIDFSSLTKTEEKKVPQSLPLKFATGVSMAANSALFGFGDEIGAGTLAAWEEVGEHVGLIPKASISDRYASYTKPAREATAQFREEYPTLSEGLDIGGGLVTGGAGAVRAGVLKALPAISRVLRGAATGGATGAVAGAGYTDEGLEDLSLEEALWERAKGAGVGLGVGSIFGAGIGGVSAAVRTLGRSQAAGIARERLKKIVTSESGAVGDLPQVKIPERLTRANSFILKMFDQATDDDILQATQRIERANQNKTPITIFEAMDLPQGYADAKALTASRGGRDVAGKFLLERRAEMPERVENILGKISSEDDVLSASRGLTDTASGIVTKLEEGRTVISKPLYKVAMKKTPIIESKKIDELLELPIVQEVLAKQRKFFPREIPEPDHHWSGGKKVYLNNKGYPDNHFKTLDYLKKGLDDRIDKLDPFEKNAANALRGIKHELTSVMDNYTPEYKHARDVYAGLSSPINWLKGHSFGDTKTRGILEDILKANPEKAGSAARALIAKKPSQLKEIRDVFEVSGKEAELRAGVRAGFQDLIDEARTGVLDDKGGAIIDKLFGRKKSIQKKLNALIGEEDTLEIFKDLELEGLISKGESGVGINLQSFGSPSTPMLRALGEHKGLFQKLKDPKGSLKEIFDSLKPTEHEQLTKEISEQLFKAANIDEFRAWATLQSRYNHYLKGFDAFTTVAEKTSTKGAITGTAGSSGESGRASTGGVVLLGSAGAGAIGGQQLIGVEENEQKRPGAISMEGDSSIGFLSPGDDSGAGLLPKTTTQKKKEAMKKQDVRAIEAEIDKDPIDRAIYETESGRNPRAKNTRSSASGGFQLIKETARSLGVTHVYDLGQNYAGYKKLRAQHERMFGSADPQVVYGAHFLGAELMRKYLAGKSLSEKEGKLVKEFEGKALPRFLRIYNRITEV